MAFPPWNRVCYALTVDHLLLADVVSVLGLRRWQVRAKPQPRTYPSPMRAGMHVPMRPRHEGFQNAAKMIYRRPSQLAGSIRTWYLSSRFKFVLVLLSTCCHFSSFLFRQCHVVQGSIFPLLYGVTRSSNYCSISWPRYV